ncbi:MAG: xanthine dehydrogenase family protein molybdopterin-binding subunit [Erysipelotrichia bacterium]|jgi:CO/xanthine dehydrogenase Mo-binding subunit|nr:xanthine dehydrogenase family protein molybdopterin-binding subunit [Erysipelotrichia bacterium]
MFDPKKSTPKVDHEEKCSGEAKYVSDIVFDNMLFAKTVRSSIAKGKIVNISVPKLPNGYHVVDHQDVVKENYVKMVFTDWPVFPVNRVNYIGEPIMLVVGPDKLVIDKIISQVVINYEEEEPVFDLVNSVAHKSFKKGNFAEASRRNVRTIKETFDTGYQEQAYIEPQGMLAYLEEGGKVTLMGSMQCPYYIKNAVINTLGYPEDKVRVIQPAVGGAFGGKEEFPSTIACQLATAVVKIKQPIKMIFEREEDMLVTTKRHPSSITLEAKIDQNNKVLGIKADVGLDAGAYIGLSAVVLSRAMLAVTDAYTIDNLEVSGNVYITNTVPTGAFRGFGSPQMIFAIEMFMTHLAKDLGVDPFTFRLNHLVKQGDLTSTSGLFRDPIIMDKMIAKATEMSDYHRKTKEYAKPGVFKGIGMSWFLHGCGFTGDGESTHIKSRVRLVKDEKDIVHLYIVAVDMGQGAKTSLKRVVAMVLDIPNEQVVFDYPDTDLAPDSGPTVASRTMMIVGGLLARAAQKLKDNWKKGEYQEIIEQYKQPDYIQWDERKLQGDAYPSYSWGVNVVEVEISPVTYEVQLKGIWSVYDIGKAIDERMVIGQADGGITQGIAYGYLENMRHEKGKLKQKNLTDYIIPTSMDMPPMETIIMDNPFLYGPYGAKGVGELTFVGGAPAVALAIENAIKRKVNRIPATPEYIMELINNE